MNALIEWEKKRRELMGDKDCRMIFIGGGITCATCGEYFKIWYQDVLAEILDDEAIESIAATGAVIVMKDEGTPFVTCPNCKAMWEVPATAEEFKQLLAESDNA